MRILAVLLLIALVVGGCTAYLWPGWANAPVSTPTSASLPTAAPTATPVPPSDPGAVKMAQGKDVVASLKVGRYYHFNLWCEGCFAGQETNYVVLINKDAPVTIRGTVWEYQRLPKKVEVWDSNDFYPNELPNFLKGIATLQPVASLP